MSWHRVVESCRAAAIEPTTYEPDASGTLRFWIDNCHALWRAKDVHIHATDPDGVSLAFDTPVLLPVEAEAWTVVQHGLWGIHRARHACVHTRCEGGIRISVPMGRIAVVSVRVDRVAPVTWGVRVQSHDISIALDYKADLVTAAQDVATNTSPHTSAQDAATNTSLHMGDVLRKDAIENTILKQQNRRLRTYSQECDDDRRVLRKRLCSTKKALDEKTRRTDELSNITLVSEKARAALRDALVESRAATAKTTQRLRQVQQDQSAQLRWTRDVLPSLIASYVGPRPEKTTPQKNTPPKRMGWYADQRRRRVIGALAEARKKTRRRRCCAW